MGWPMCGEMKGPSIGGRGYGLFDVWSEDGGFWFGNYAGKGLVSK